MRFGLDENDDSVMPNGDDGRRDGAARRDDAWMMEYEDDCDDDGDDWE